MSGGRFVSMNKVRPGAYINFETNASGRIRIGTRGIATLIQALSWGPEQALIEISGADMINGSSLAKIGLLQEEADALPINLALQNCDTVKVFNSRSGGTRASVALGEEPEPGEESSQFIVTAKYPGTFGNKIAIVIKESGNAFIVETYADGYAVDSQKVANSSQLVANDYVTFNDGNLLAISSTLLSGGTDGTTSDSLNNYFEALKLTKWNTMAYMANDNITTVVDFIREMREAEGKYVQAVVSNYDGADYEGLINNVNGVVLEDGTQVTSSQFTAWVAGATAGADITESITGKVVEGATSIIGLLSNDEIITALQTGKFVLSLNQAGNVKVEKDINSLHTFTIDKSYTFSKNRIIRELDEIGSSIEDIWETTYLGKVSNNENGRTLFKSSIINFLTDLQNRGAVDEFDSANVQVSMGEDADSVIVELAIKPVDSMEFLYVTVNIEQ